MKLVQLLAKELKEWPEGVGKAMQDFDMEIRFFDLAGEQMTLLDFYIDELASDACDESRFAGGGVEITKSQWQAERKKMNKPKWIRHRGGKCPVPCGTKVETRHRNGYICTPHFYTQNSSSDVGMNLVWSHKGDKMDIMAYRVIEETKDQEIEEVKVADVKLEMLQGDSLVTIGSVSSDFGASVFDGGQPAKGEEVKKQILARSPTSWRLTQQMRTRRLIALSQNGARSNPRLNGETKSSSLKHTRKNFDANGKS